MGIFSTTMSIVVQESIKIHTSIGRVSSLERSLAAVIPHIGQKPCTCPNIDPHWSFSSQILTIPFLWKLFPYLGEVNLKGLVRTVITC